MMRMFYLCAICLAASAGAQEASQAVASAAAQPAVTTVLTAAAAPQAPATAAAPVAVAAAAAPVAPAAPAAPVAPSAPAAPVVLATAAAPVAPAAPAAPVARATAAPAVVLATAAAPAAPVAPATEAAAVAVQTQAPRLRATAAAAAAAAQAAAATTAVPKPATEEPKVAAVDPFQLFQDALNNVEKKRADIAELNQKIEIETAALASRASEVAKAYLLVTDQADETVNAEEVRRLMHDPIVGDADGSFLGQFGDLQAGSVRRLAAVLEGLSQMPVEDESNMEAYNARVQALLEHPLFDASSNIIRYHPSSDVLV